MMPWVLLAFMVVIFISGLIGMYIGYTVADNRFQEAKIHMIANANAALDERDDRLHEQAERNVRLENEFMSSIDKITSNYKTLSQTMTAELKNDIYSKCQVPLTGKALLQKRVKEANARR
jgi:uncharacterized membrane-anchored protein YhcB (DUF1043 family)